jgi:hypothetical protein
VTDLFGKSVYVSLEPDLTSGVGRNTKRLDHAGLSGDQLGSYNRFCDTVRLGVELRMPLRKLKMLLPHLQLV